MGPVQPPHPCPQPQAYRAQLPALWAGGQRGAGPCRGQRCSPWRARHLHEAVPCHPQPWPQCPDSWALGTPPAVGTLQIPAPAPGAFRSCPRSHPSVRLHPAVPATASDRRERTLKWRSPWLYTSECVCLFLHLSVCPCVCVHDRCVSPLSPSPPGGRPGGRISVPCFHHNLSECESQFCFRVRLSLQAYK